MKKIIGLTALLLFSLGISVISFAQPVPTACQVEKNLCNSRCDSLPTNNDVSICKEECGKTYQDCLSCMDGGIRQNGTCVNDFAADQAAQLQACLAKCKDKDGNVSESCECKCKGGIVLNTNFPFIGRCIDKAGNGEDGKSSLIGISSAFSDIMMTLILTAGFAMVIRGGVQIAMGQIKEGRQKIVNVVIAFAALGSLGILLRLINPNFFK